MELLSPAGNIEKLKIAYRYGADAAYIGLQNFSLRAKADNFDQSEFQEIAAVKGGNKLFCALNVYFREHDRQNLDKQLDEIELYPFDAFIISDIGIVKTLQDRFPETALHLSTQANCTNGEAAKMYRDMGFSRIILARELSLSEIDGIKRAVPDVEIEAFVHGAMCLAYSGRCYLSAYMSDRSANSGQCAHSCRWEYRVLEEKQRPGEYFPVIEEDGYSTILSSKDLCMIDHLKSLRDAGVDSCKIEGRMKSIYYVAVVTRAYRKAIDELYGKHDELIEQYKAELQNVSHREYSTGFFFDSNDIEIPARTSYVREYTLMGSLERKVSDHTYVLSVKNKINTGEELEVIGPEEPGRVLGDYTITDTEGNGVDFADHRVKYLLTTSDPVEPGYIIRKRASI